MGKYAESVGIWEHTLKGITHKIIPEEGDNIEFVRAKTVAQQKNDAGLLYPMLSELYFKMVVRSNPSLTEQDKKELRVWISFNIPIISDDMMVAFNWTTKEELDKLKEVQISKKKE